MAEAVKLTEEELGELKNTTERVNVLRRELADVGMVKLNLETREAQIKQFHKESIEIEQALAKKLEEKYGKGTVDIDQGTFTPAEE